MISMEFTTYQLKDLLTIKNGKDHKHLEDGAYPVLVSGGIMRYANDYLYDRESILLPRKGTLSNIQYINEPFWTVDTLFYSKLRTGIYNPYYLFLYLNYLDLSGYDSGASIPSMTIKGYNKIKVILPSLDKQNDIANLIKKYDLLIENNNKRIKILDQMAEELYKEWFVRFRYPNCEKYKIRNGIPEYWNVVKIGDVCEVVGGGTPSTKIDEYWDGDIPWITPADLAKHEIPRVFKGERNITDLAINKSGAKLLKKNTIILSSRAPIGYVAISSTEMCTNQGCKNLECDDNLINYYYLFMWLKNNKDLLNSYGSGATFLELSIKSLSKIKLLLPSIELQNRFGDYFEKIDAEITNLALQNENLIKQRDLLLPRLMSGKLEVK